MARTEAPIIEFDLDRNLAVYDAADVEYTVDTGVFIQCPGCIEGVILHRAVESGCFDHNCGRGPWSVEIRQREVDEDE